MALGFSRILHQSAVRNLQLKGLKCQLLELNCIRVARSLSSAVNPQQSVQDGRPANATRFGNNSVRRISRPKRIERSPIDILDTLAATVGKDPTGPHYRFMDDPYFIPTTTTNRRLFALAKESGRKAARFIAKKYPDLFKKPKPDPVIPAFLTSSQLDYEIPENPTTDNLTERMKAGGLVSAVAVYQVLHKTKEVPREMQQELLERLCYHNSEDALDNDLMEEKWFSHYLHKDVRRRWTANGAAEKIFKDINPKTPEAYAALICGMAKFLFVEQATKLFEEMQAQNVPVQVFNEMLHLVPLSKDAVESRWELTMSLLSQMSQQGVAPNLRTFNAVLEVLSKIAMWKRARPLALSILSEMKRCGIEPSLASYHYLLHIFCRERGPVSHILHDILRELKGKELAVRDPVDTLFFCTAMEVASRHLQDPVVAKQVYDMVLEDNNVQFLSDAHKENLFYGNFLRVLVAGESVENFFKLYDDIVPMSFIPDTFLFQEMTKMVEFHDQLEHLPRIWSDAITFGLALKENMLEGFLQVLVDNHREELKGQFAAIALDVKTRIDGQPTDRAQRTPWTGPVMSSVIMLLVRNDQVDTAWEVVAKYLEKKTETFGFPSQEGLRLLVDAMAVNPIHSTNIKQCLVLAADLGFVDLINRAGELAETLQLSANEAQQWGAIGAGSITSALVEEES